MEVETFKYHVSKWKQRTQRQTPTRLDVKHKNHVRFTITDKEGKGVVVWFKKPTTSFQNIGLSIFQAQLMYGFYCKKKPRGYADYHECTAGERFIQNIDRIQPLVASKKVVAGETIK